MPYLIRARCQITRLRQPTEDRANCRTPLRFSSVLFRNIAAGTLTVSVRSCFLLSTNRARRFMPVSISFVAAWKGVPRARQLELSAEVPPNSAEACGNCGCASDIPAPLPC